MTNASNLRPLSTINFVEDRPFYDLGSPVLSSIGLGKVALVGLVASDVMHDFYIDLTALRGENPEFCSPLFNSDVTSFDQMWLSRHNGVVFDNSQVYHSTPEQGVLELDNPERLCGLIVSGNERSDLEERMGDSITLGEPVTFSRVNRRKIGYGNNPIWVPSYKGMGAMRTKTVVPLYRS